MTQLDAELAAAYEGFQAMQAYFDKLSETPISQGPVPVAPPTPPVQGIEAQATPDPQLSGQRLVLSQDDMDEMGAILRTRSVDQLQRIFAKQAIKEGQGIPLELWAGHGGPMLYQALQQNPILQKALDTVGGAALIRQDLEPVLRELFVRTFPAYERFAKEPSNGLVHTFQQMTSFGGAVWMPELGTVTDDKSTYVRKTTNIGVVATRRGVTLKEMYAVAQSGSGFNPQATELRGGLLSISSAIQTAIFQGNADPTQSGGTAADEDGLFDENSFTGMRSQTKTADVNVDPFASTPEDIRAAIEQAAVEVGDQGGQSTILYGSYPTKRLWDIQQDKNLLIRPQDQVDLAVGVRVVGANTLFGLLPFVGVPGPYVGTYSKSGETIGDLYLFDETNLSLPYLGSESPQVLEIPIGVNGQLSRMWIIFSMVGLANKAAIFQNKVRVYQS